MKVKITKNSSPVSDVLFLRRAISWKSGHEGPKITFVIDLLFVCYTLCPSGSYQQINKSY